MVYLIEALHAAARRSGSLIVRQGQQEETATWAEVYSNATGLAGMLQASGVRAGMAVGVLGATSRTLVTTVQAAWRAGASVTIVAPPIHRADVVSLAAAVDETAKGARLDIILICPPFTDSLPVVNGCRTIIIRDAASFDSSAHEYVEPRLGDGDSAILQFTSGSTSAPKAVRITHGNLAANLAGLRTRTTHDDVHNTMLSWLPLYHDMGLIGFLALPMTCGGCRLVLSPPEEFLTRPWSWLENISTYRATATAAPNFAYSLAAKFAKETDLDLSSLQFALSGGEPIDPAIMDAFVASTAQFGLNPGVVVCAYGMAETTVAISMPQPGGGMRVDVVDAATMQECGRADPASAGSRILRLPLLGLPLPGLDIRVVNPSTGEILADREVGEMQIRGSSVTPGYVNEGHNGPLFDGEWLRSGDLGYRTAAGIVVCGRSKEVIFVAGRNVLPYDVEKAACQVDGVRPGRVAAFRGADGQATDSLVVAVEVTSSITSDLRRAIAEEVTARVGVRPREVIALPDGVLPKTSSGKMRRIEARRRFLAGGLT